MVKGLNKTLCALWVAIYLPSCWAAGATPLLEVVSVDEVDWGYLNPLRGDKSPAAADLWGDRAASGATGMLVKFNPGFSSPPHIHNISYRGVVIEGEMHNDDPHALNMWLPAGSFWTQPAGESHITAANGKRNVIYLEIDSGPYLVEPVDKQFDNGERPVNIHADNQVWLGQGEAEAIQTEGVQISYLWQHKGPKPLRGVLLKLPAGFQGQIASAATELRLVVIQGGMTHAAQDESSQPLLPGSYIHSAGQYQHRISTTDTAILYIRTNGALTVTSSDPL